MQTIKEKIFFPLQQGVKLIGIGKHGSKKLPDELIVEINEERGWRRVRELGCQAWQEMAEQLRTQRRKWRSVF